jgi:hypothetical protein
MGPGVGANYLVTVNVSGTWNAHKLNQAFSYEGILVCFDIIITLLMIIIQPQCWVMSPRLLHLVDLLPLKVNC